MARDHHDAWDRTIDVIAKEDIIGKRFWILGVIKVAFTTTISKGSIQARCRH